MPSSIIPAARDLPAVDRVGLTDRVCRKVLLSQLARIQNAQVTLLDRGERMTFGQADSGLHCTLTVQHPRFYRDSVLGGHLGAAEGYIHGLWDCDDLTALVRIFARNLALSDQMDRLSVRLGGALLKLGHYLKRNTLLGSQNNIAAHYDLGNDFFELLLDPTLTYSCAVFESPEVSLMDAQVAKLDRLIDKLGLDAGQHLLEIGTGWGALAVRAAQRTGCKVTTTTLSQQQHDHARKLIDDNNLADRVTLLKRDYRELTGQYDKLVSVEMIEAVGHRFYGQFFEACGRLLKPTGRGVIQSITIPDDRYDSARHCVDFIKKYVFPGSCIPSIGVLRDAMSRSSDLKLTHFEELGPHYATTLRYWADNLQANHKRILERGYPRELMRLWDFYLAYCAGGFIEHNIGLAQIEVRRAACKDSPLAVEPIKLIKPIGVLS